MSRVKKSRKPASGAIGVVKVDKKSLTPPSPRKPKKKKGKPSGNRQQEAMVKKNKVASQSMPKDPRVGSKKPIELGKALNTNVSENVKKPAPKNKKQPEIAAVRPVIETLSYQDQIMRIEQDEALLAIIEKQENEQSLTSEEVDYFNQLMTEHEKLSALIESPIEDVAITTETTESDLWDKLDSSDLSKFE